MKTKRIKKLSLVGKTATVACLIMYFSYIEQIIANLTSKPVPSIQPLFAAINAFLWVTYGFLKDKKDLPIIIANLPGVILGLITFLTSIVK
nr:SemiSWEET family transporter [Liquorilactobacillus satsumensis]